MSDNKDGEVQSKKPVDSDFQQQRLRAWQPLLTPFWVILTFTLVGILFMILGAVCISASMDVIEVTSEEYQADDALLIGGAGYPTSVNITVPSDMKAPVYFYYKLTNFFQNHRRYVKSRSDNQLRGAVDTTNCDPLTTNGGLDYYPCGLIANSMFNDTLKLSLNGLPTLNHDNRGIAWASDLSTKFVPRLPTSQETTIGAFGQRLPNVTDEDFIVWMRTAGLPTFKKLKYIIRQDLKAGDIINVQISQYFRVTSFGGTKSLVLSTANWLGGKNDFLGIAYLVVGGICLVLALAFGAKHHFSPRPLGDMKYFNWPGIGRSAGR